MKKFISISLTLMLLLSALPVSATEEVNAAPDPAPAVVEVIETKAAPAEPASHSVSAPVITTQPEDQTSVLGETAEFTVEATGEGLTYQWQWQSANGGDWGLSGLPTAKSASLEVPATADRNGQHYRCVITDANGNSVNSDAVTLTISKPAEPAPALAITTQPENQTAALGETATFTVEATGEGLTYQWQWQSANGGAWGNSGLATAKSASLEVPATADRNGQHYRCVVTDANGQTVASEAATLTIGTSAEPTELAITGQPEDQTAALDETTTFTVVATGNGLSYQWQWQGTGGYWGNSGLPTANSASLEVPATADRNGQRYRCIITDANGNSVTSEAATLTIKASDEPVAELAITAQPEDQTAALDETATFTVVATGNGLSYQWQWESWDGRWSASGLPTANSASLEVPATEDRNGQRYRCVITDANGQSITSEPATLTVGEAVEFAITAQPEDQTATLDETATFTVVATGNGLSYQWQWESWDGRWSASGLPTANSASLEVPATEDRNGQRYRCVITDANGQSITSEPATLTVGEAVEFAITAQPEDQTATLDETATFTVVATGNGLTYQWQWQGTGGYWGNSGLPTANSASLEVPASVDRNGQSYRCIITDANGNSVTSEAATLTVEIEGDVLSIATHPEDQTVALGEIATFTVEATGEGLAYQWQWLNINTGAWDNSGLPTANSASLEVPATEDRNGQSYRCLVTDATGNSMVSNAAILTIETDPTIVLNDVIYGFYEDGLEIIGYTGTASSLTIPATVEGYTVIRIGDSAFEGNATLANIDLPDTIQTIGKRAFANCSRLSNMN